MRKVNSRNRLLFILAILLTLGFVGGSGLNYEITKASVHRQIVQNDLPLTMNNIYSDITAELTRPILVSSSMAADTFLQDWVLEGEQNQERVQKYLLEIKESYGFFSTFFVSAYTSNYYHFKGLHKVINPADSHDVWYYRFIASGKEYNLDVDTDEAADNILTVFINYRVEDEEGRLLGVAGVGLKMESVARLVQEYKERYGRSVFLSDRAGLIQVHQDTSLINNVHITEIDGLKDVTQDVLKVGKIPENFEYKQGNDSILVNVRYIDNLDWLLFVEQNETESLLTAKMNFIRTVAIGLFISIVIFITTLLTINRFQRQLEQLAISDELTGVANRRKLEEDFQKYVSRYSRSGQFFSLILMDLDGFKKVNDTLGHLQGDTVLQIISGVIAKNLRPTDVLARWGGDEFAILTESTLQGGVVVAERVRMSVEQITWPEDNKTTPEADPRMAVSVSLGLAQFRDGEKFEHTLSRADNLLYLCKQRGGNRVEASE